MELRRYLTASGRDVFGEWLSRLRDARTRARIVARIDRLSAGNFGDAKALRDGLFELRIDWGPGYRVYYAVVGRSCVLLICGGDKRKQTSDIKRALEYLTDYRRRTR
ncbi:MAG: type II toxin-antitoxin system RelE/ParE family toxin [Terriglobales bacterium]|jgi:putative addiction module killer protein